MKRFGYKVSDIFTGMIIAFSRPRKGALKRIQVFLVILALTPTSAFAYIGPGVGLGAIATFIAIFLGLLLIIVGFLWYPLKRMLRKRRQTETKGSPEEAPESGNQ